MQLGGRAFARSVAVEGLGLTARLLSASRHALNGAEALLLAAGENSAEDSARRPYLERAATAAASSAQRLASASEAAANLSEAYDAGGSRGVVSR